jgi:hypothetical protein
MRPRAWHHLDELFAGSCDGMTYEEIEAQFPDEWERRNVDKLAYRYPRGESYLDVIARLEPIIIEMERHREPLVIIAHQAILRIIYAFYLGKTRAEAPYLSIPLNTVIELNPGPIIIHEKVRSLMLTFFLADNYPNHHHIFFLYSATFCTSPQRKHFLLTVKTNQANPMILHLISFIYFTKICRFLVVFFPLLVCFIAHPLFFMLLPHFYIISVSLSTGLCAS